MIGGAPRSDWLTATANAFQVLIGALSGHIPLESADRAFQRIPEPRDETERIVFRYLVSDLLLTVTYFRKPLVRRDVLESIRRAWYLIRHDPQPVTAFRHALAPDNGLASTREVVLAEHVRDLLERRYHERLRLRAIANIVGVSETTMKRCFRSTYGATIHQYLLMVRVGHGLELVTKGMKVEAASLAVGFRSKKDFYRAVQHFVGCTPAQFRVREARRG